MKINRKIQNIGLAIIAGIALIGFIIGCFLDEQLTNKIGDFDSLYGIMFAGFGPIPVLAIGTLVGSFLLFMPKIEHKKWNVVLRVLGVLTIAVMIFAQVKEGVDYLEFPRMEPQETTYKVLMLTFIAILNLFIILYSRLWVKKIETRKLIVISLLILAVIVIYFVAGEAIKYLASRPRPRIIIIKHRLYFKAWYEWKPFAALFNEEYEGCKSFVSGHTANAACMITLLPLTVDLFRKENSNKLQIICLIIGGIFTVIVAFSRIVALAHWLTDVTGGILVSCAAQALVINVAPKIIKKFEK